MPEADFGQARFRCFNNISIIIVVSSNIVVDKDNIDFTQTCIVASVSGFEFPFGE